MTCKLYRHFASDGELLYIGISMDLTQRIRGHASRSLWFDDVKTISIESYANKRDARIAEELAIKKELPKHNKEYRRTRQPTKIELEIIEIIPFDKWSSYEKRRYKKLTPEKITEIRARDDDPRTVSWDYPAETNTIKFIRGQDREDELAMDRYKKKKEKYDLAMKRIRDKEQAIIADYLLKNPI